jgi:ferredoxin
MTTIAYDEIAAAFAAVGLEMRGGFLAAAGEVMPEAAAGTPGRTVLLVGNVGGSLWARFARERRDEPHPLDAWTKRTVEPLAARFEARAYYPSDPPYQPFQRWAMRAEPVHPSPLGLLIHPDHGLWHAYRAALVLGREISGLPQRSERPSPCTSCADRPCLTACPVGAFTGAAYDVAACTGHLHSRGEPRCLEAGCRARAACPVGRHEAYGTAQIRFHMAAFLKARS